MLLNLIYLFSALFACGVCAASGGFGTGSWLWQLPLIFLGGILLGLLMCFLVVWVLARRTSVTEEFESDDPLIRTVIRLYAPAVFRLLGCKIEVVGGEKLPREGRFQLVSNHLADLDPGIFFEHDVFFARQQGCDVYAYLRSHADRVRTVHLKQINAQGENVDLPDGIIDMAQVIRCALKATDYILEQASFKEGIPQSLRRNAEYIKRL